MDQKLKKYMYQATVVELTVQKHVYNRMCITLNWSQPGHITGDHNTMRRVKHQDLFKQIHLFRGEEEGGGQVGNRTKQETINVKNIFSL